MTPFPTHPLAKIGVLREQPQSSDPRLPEGHDKPKHPMFVPPELRPFWPDARTQAEYWEGIYGSSASQAKELATGLPHTIYDAAEWTIRREIAAAGQEQPASIVQYGHGEHGGFESRARRLTDDEKLSYLHHRLTREAQRRAARVENSAAHREKWQAEHTCESCQRVASTVRRWRLDPRTGDHTGATVQDPQMCLPCVRVAERLMTEQDESEQLDGKSRRQLVQQWLAKSPRAESLTSR